MFGGQRGTNVPGAAAAGTSGGQPMRSSVFGGAVPARSAAAAAGGQPTASSVFGGLATGSIGSSTFGGGHSSTPRSVFGGGGGTAHVGQPSPASTAAGGLTPAAVFGNRPSAPSVFGACPVSSPAPAAAVQQSGSPGGFFGGLQPLQPSHTGTVQQSVPNAAGHGSGGGQAVPATAGVLQAASPASEFGARPAAFTARDVFGAHSGKQLPVGAPAVFGVLASAAGMPQPPPAAGSVSGPGLPRPVASGFAVPPFGGGTTWAHASHAADGGRTTMPGGSGGGSSSVAPPPTTMVAAAAASRGLFGKAAPADVLAGASPSSSASLPQPAVGLFGKAPGAASAAAGATVTPVAALQQSGLLRPLYSELSDLTDGELAQFKAVRFTLTKVPLKPPPRQLVQ